jgi:TPR repeat protein
MPIDPLLKRALASLLLALAAAAPARADFEAGIAAARAGDYATALREWRPLAHGGHRDAQFNLGLLYENGLGVAADGGEAARWYRRAAEQDDRQAQAYLAEMYAKGLGIPRDDIEALRWYRRAAERGHAASQYNVGLFYATGRGVAPSDVQAVAWITVSLENGAAPTELLGVLRKHMSAASMREATRLADEVRRQCRLD